MPHFSPSPLTAAEQRALPAGPAPRRHCQVTRCRLDLPLAGGDPWLVTIIQRGERCPS